MKKKHEFNFNSFKDADAILRNNALDEEIQNKMREGKLVEMSYIEVLSLIHSVIFSDKDSDSKIYVLKTMILWDKYLKPIRL